MRKLPSLIIVIIFFLIPSISAEELYFDITAGCTKAISLGYKSESNLYFSTSELPEGFTVEFSPNPTKYGTTMYVTTAIDLAPETYTFDIFMYVEDENNQKTIHTAIGTRGESPETTPPPKEEKEESYPPTNVTTGETWYFEGKEESYPYYLLGIIPILGSIIIFLLWKKKKEKKQ
jgi:hypothetical protein